MRDGTSRVRLTKQSGIVLILGFICLQISQGVFAQDQGGPPEVPSNWKVKEVAEYPEIKYPSVVEVAPDGRIFVGEDPMDMPGPPDKPIDRVVCFHPDGRKTVVAEDLYAVFGMLYLDGKLYVHHPPRLSVFELEDGKGVNRRELIETVHPNPWVGTNLNDHIPSQIRLGMDGYIYMSVGDKGIYGAEGTDGSTAQLQGGGILRFRPDGSDLEVYASGTRNHLDVAITSQDEMFTYDNTDDGNGWWTRVTHMVDGGYYGYPFDYKPRRPYTLWMMQDYGGGSPTGALAYTGARLPEKFHDDLFMCEWGKRAVVRFEVSRDGATYQIDHRERFFSRSGDTFAPLGIDMAQDGTSFYVTDWNHGGWKKDLKRGQLFKMTYTGETRDVSIPKWYVRAGNGHSVNTSTDRLIEEGLKHPARRVRMVAQRQLADRGKAVIPEVKKMMNSKQVPAHAIWHGIWTLDAIDGGRSARKLILKMTQEGNPASVRRQALRQLGTREVGSAAEHLVNYLEDDDASIRFWAATALGRIGDTRTVPSLLDALVQDDLFARYAAFNALNRIGRTNPDAWHKIAKGFHSSNEKTRSGTRFAMRETYKLENVNALADVVRTGSSEKAREAALKTLAPLMRKQKPWKGDWWGTQPIKDGPRPKSETWAGTEIVRNTLQTVLKKGSYASKEIVVNSMSDQNIPALVPILLDLYNKAGSEQLKELALNGLTSTPDERALNAYIDGLAYENEEVRVSSRKALRAIASSVRDEVIQKVRETSVSDDVLEQLSMVFAKPVPIRNWHLVGPFEKDRSPPFDLQNISLDQTFDGKNSTVSWTKVKGGKDHGQVDLEEELQDINNASAFARSILKVEDSKKTELVLGSDDGLRVWVNGEKVFEDMGNRGWGPDQFRVPVSLKKGKNEIVCKIEEDSGAWAFSVKYISRDFLKKVKSNQ